MFRPRNIQHAARLAVGLCGVPDDFAAEARQESDEFCQVFDPYLGSRADVHWSAVIVAFGREYDAFGRIVGMNKFTCRCARSPQDHFRIAISNSIYTLLDNGGNRVRRFRIEVIAGTIQIDWEKIDSVESELLTICLRLNEEHFLGQTIWSIGFF